MPEAPVVVAGVAGDRLGHDAVAAAAAADLVVAAPRLLALLPTAPTRALAVEGDLGAVVEAVATEPGRVCVLASGDPGFFGIVRPLAERLGPGALDVRPAPSSVALAFARLGVAWDDAAVVSAHGRSLADAARVAAAAAKAAVLVSPASPPEALGRQLLALGARHRRVAVCSRLAMQGERVDVTDLAGLAAGRWDPFAVVLLLDGGVGAPAGRSLAWGLPEDAFAHRDGMVTKAEVRAVALGKLALPPAGVLWDVGAGSGSVALECARLCPALRVLAVERDPDAVDRIRANAAGHGVAVEVVEGKAPDVLADLPDPDRAFVGGGGLDVLDAVLARMRPGGRVTATYAALDRAVAAYHRLGHLTQVSVSRGQPLPGGGVRLEAENPVFVTWGPE